MTPLRQRFIDDLRLRNKSPRTIETYVLRVALFARHFGRSPEVLGPDEIRAYQQHLLDRHVSWSMFNQTVCALRFLYNVTLGRPDVIRHLPFAKRPRTVPSVLSPEEVMRLLDAALPGRDRTLLDVAYPTLYGWIKRGWVDARRLYGSHGRLVIRADQKKLIELRARAAGEPQSQEPQKL
jgi:site-specific recombinase XerD